MSDVDWIICLGSLAFVFGQGWWFARGQATNEEYFVGSRTMNWMAVGLSLFATAFSANSFVGLPREGAYADYHLFLAILFIPLFVAPIVGWLFVPLYHRLQLTSAYEYLERRFDRRLRLFGSLLYGLYTIGWMGSMLYATGVMVQAALNIDHEKMLWILIGLGLFTTLYTSVGGYKAVIWTDVVQAAMLAGVVLLMLFFAVARVDGGWDGVWAQGWEAGRFQMFELNLDLKDRANFFNACAFGMFVYFSAYATGQASVQRYVSMPSVSAARWSLALYGVVTAGVCGLFFLLGTALFAFYHQAGGAFPSLPKQEQLTIHFVQTELVYSGVLGLLLAGLFAAVMSSISSGINSLSALMVCDWLSGRRPGIRLSRLLSAAFGLATILAALIVPSIGEHVFDIIIKLSGAFFGPLLGLFLVGMLVPRANAAGAGIGLLAGAISLALVNQTSISPWWYGAFTCVPTFVVGVLASFCFPPPTPGQVEGLTVRWGARRSETPASLPRVHP
jgi:SSS family transporter